MATTTKAKPKKTTTEAKDAKKAAPPIRKAMTDEAVAKALKTLHGWAHKNDTIEKTYSFKDYLDGLAFATTVGTIAQGFDHHPDILIKWRKVTVTFSTHDADNKVTATDIKVAEAIEALPYKPEG
ncbi:MAG: 4a-hydroxytetrahydrobiopterin dehydratase [Anaerolineae bacterium]|nr:4a-hydroxytetrahydrobiopterin dehydratase [Anaerolineae bacterium]